MLITAEDTYTVPTLCQGERGFDVAITGTFVGTVTTQLSKDGSTGWIDVGSSTTPTVSAGDINTAWFVRAGFKTGEFTSGTADVVIY